MTKPRFDPTFSLEGILTLLILLVTFVAGYVKLQGRVQEQAVEQGEMKVAQAATSKQVTRVAVAMEMISHDLKSFPIHRHIPGGAIIYPAAPDRPDPPAFLEERGGVGISGEVKRKSGQGYAAEPKKSSARRDPAPARREQSGSSDRKVH